MFAAPKPTPKPTVTPTKAPAADLTAAAGDGFNVWSWLFHNPIAIPIIIIALWIGALYGWSQLRRYYLAKGRPVAPLGSIVRRVWRFAFKEDKAPVLAKIKPLAEKTTWLTGTRLYLILLALIPISAATHIIPTPLIIFILAVTLTARARPVFRARWAIQMQMFGVVAAECKYPRGAELNPWGYVSIQNWTNLTTPGQTVITYPPAYQSEDRNARDKFERNFNGTVSDENSWNYTWESTKNRVIAKPTDFLPSMANYPGPGLQMERIRPRHHRRRPSRLGRLILPPRPRLRPHRLRQISPPTHDPLPRPRPLRHLENRRRRPQDGRNELAQEVRQRPQNRSHPRRRRRSRSVRPRRNDAPLRRNERTQATTTSSTSPSPHQHSCAWSTRHSTSSPSKASSPTKEKNATPSTRKAQPSSERSHD